MRDRKWFLGNAEVRGFVAWLARNASTLKVDLNIPRSSKVPGGVAGTYVGLEAVTAAYKWRARWSIPALVPALVKSCDWPETQHSLRLLSTTLKDQLRDGGSTEDVCEAILRWGGDRNPRLGAGPFLRKQHSLGQYLLSARQELQLAHADLEGLGAVQKMNSMLTKVHALAADDGLPIYDSRVAAAIATLVEIFRSCEKLPWSSIPEVLRFPSVDDVRDVSAVYSNALTHGSVAQRNAEAAHRWTEAKVRLGWILAQTLIEAPDLMTAASGEEQAIAGGGCTDAWQNARI